MQRSARSEAEVFRVFKEQLRRLGLRGSLGLLDEAGEQLIFKAIVVYPARVLPSLERLTTLRAEGFAVPIAAIEAYQHVLETRQGLYLADNSAVIAQILPEAARPQEERIIKILGQTPVIYAPLVIAGQVAGILGVNDAYLTPADVPALEAFANHTAVALENAYFHQEHARQTQDLTLINSLNVALNRGDSLPKILDLLSKETRRAFACTGAAIYLLSEDKKYLILQEGYVPPGAKNPIERLLAAKIPAVKMLLQEDNPYWKIIHVGRPQIINEPEAIQHLITAHTTNKRQQGLVPAIAKVLNLQSVILVPLVVEGEPIGLLSASRREPFSQADQQRFETLIGPVMAAIRRKQMEDKLVARNHALEILHTIAVELNRSMELNGSLKQALEQILTLLGLTGGWVMLLDEDGRFQLAAAHGLPPTLVEDLRQRSTACDCQRQLLAGEVDHAVNVLKCQRLSEVEGNRAELKLHASIPLYLGRRWLGLINVASLGSTPFTEERLRLLTSIGHQVSMTVERTRLYEQFKIQRIQDQQTLLHLSNTLIGLTDPQTIIDSAARTIQQALQVDYVSLMTPEVTGQRLVLRGGVGWEPELYGHYRVDIGTSREGYTYREVEVVQQFDVPSGEPFPCPVELKRRGVSSSLTAPLRGQEGVLGTLCIHSTQPRHFSSDEVRLLFLIASQTAAALERAWLFEAERAARTHAETLQAATQALSATLDLQQVLSLILSELQRVVPYDSASVQQLQGQKLIIIGGHGFPNLEEIVGLSFDLTATDNPNREVIATQAPLILEDAPLSYANFRTEPHAPAAVRSWLGVPLLFGDRLIGMIALDKREPGFYTGELTHLAMAFAVKAAIAIENARLFTTLQQSEEKYRGLFEGIPIGLYRSTPNGQILAANAALVRILGYPDRDALLRAKVPELYADPEGWQHRQALMEANGLVQDYEARLFRYDGQNIWVRDNARAVRDAEDQVLYYEGSLEDITQHKEAEEEVHRRNRELALLNEVIAVCAANIDKEAILSGVCRELCHAFNIPQAAAILFIEENSTAVVVAEHHHGDQLAALGLRFPVAGNPAAQHILTHKTPLVIQDVQNDLRLAALQPDLAQRSSRFFLALPLSIAGQVIGLLGLEDTQPRQVSIDELNLAQRVADQVSGALARLRLQEERQQMQAQYYQAQKMDALGRLTGGIAHDFNNLLTVINIYAELLQRRLPVDSPYQNTVDHILNSGNRAAKLVGQLLAFSRKQIIEPVVLDLNLIVSELDTMLGRVISEHIALKIHLAPNLWPVKVDPSQIEQVIVNLAVNARDAMPHGGELTIETANSVLDDDYAAHHLGVEAGDYVLLAISDTGHGMSPEIQARMFEPFFTTKEQGKGTGLGLTTVFGIVEQNRGHIWVSSEEGQGTTFKIYLPRVEAKQPVTIRPKDKAEMPTGSETILLVEDNEAVRNVAGHILQEQGYQLLEAVDVQAAIQLVAQFPDPIHLLLTDVVMPGMSGQALAEQLTHTRPTLKILFMSGYTDEAIVQHGVLEEGVAFLQKPFTPLALAHKVREILDS